MPSTLSTPQTTWNLADRPKVEPSTQGTTGIDAIITLDVGTGNPAILHLTKEHVNALLQGLQDVVKARQNVFGV